MWVDALRAAMPEEEVMLVGDLTEAHVTDNVDIALVRGVDPGELRRFPRLRFIHCLWAGVDGLLTDPSVPTEVPLARTVDPAMADRMAATALAHVLDICLLHHDYREKQKRASWEPRHAKPMTSKTVAILGFGSLGRRCAEYIAITGAAVIGVRSTRTTAVNHAPWTTTTNMDDAVAAADVVINLLPLTTETTGVLNAALFAHFRPGAAFINLGRGNHVVDPDLLAALAEGRIRRAVLDVFGQEPLPGDHPYWRHPGVTITPHVAAETDPMSAAAVIAANIRAFRAGHADRITGLVDRARGY